jgi:PAS domain S-box-containing protein
MGRARRAPGSKRSRSPPRLRRGAESSASPESSNADATATENAQLRGARDEIERVLARYTDLYDFAPAGYFSVDERGLILEVNLTGAVMLGTARSGLVHRRLERFVGPASRPVFQAFLRRVFERPETQTCEVSLRCQDGTAIWANFQAASAASLRDSHRWCRVTVSDVTAVKRGHEALIRVAALAAKNRELSHEISRRHKVEKALKESERHQRRLLDESRRMQEQLRQLSRGILEAQEEERKRIGRELHDDVAQSAVGISIQMELLSRAATERPALRRKRIAQTRRLIEKLMEVIDRFSRELRPTVLDDLGLIPALKSFTKEFSRRTGIDVRFASTAATKRLNNTQRTVLYRVAQEALTNVVKHAHATRVDVTIEEVRGIVCMEVADDGKAFRDDLAKSGKGHPPGLGILGMRERVEMVGGSFAIESAAGKGTRVRVRIPIADSRASALETGLPHRRGGR